jgi:hypothetical protein
MQPSQYSSAGAAGAGCAIPTAPGIKPTIRTNAEKDPFLLLKGDHDSFRALMDALPSASPEQKRVICLELSREIVAHASIEEQWLHQLYKEHLGAEGVKFFDDSLVADQRNLNALSVLERESKGGLSDLSGEAQEAFKQLTDTEFEHMRLEEEVRASTPLMPLSAGRLQQLSWRSLWACDYHNLLVDSCTYPRICPSISLQVYFPKLRAALTPEKITQLYDHLVAAKGSAPTHAHTWRPDKPGIAKVGRQRAHTGNALL